ncbi:hypothetical protein [Microbacterium sp. VKM Ac-2923]|uniref:Acb2/Tad1 domain-containing protein n=1 Tax=Microbacterium sp. VKM Ac-2923 TaxID=2929476 RepID=UPI001FB3B914|nr:hypothetical protein [Microbacterium sp. VKM Ac-2923]MCJ1709244.1 hypothetical protein [Microbacterium sp. VKM Ac-2923]
MTDTPFRLDPSLSEPATSTDRALTGPVVDRRPADAIAARFTPAATSSPPTPVQHAHVAALQADVITLARSIDALVPDGRDKSIALTALEDVQMRANRGVFADAR